MAKKNIIISILVLILAALVFIAADQVYDGYLFQKNTAVKRYDHGTISTATFSINVRNGAYQTLTLGTNAELTSIYGWPGMVQFPGDSSYSEALSKLTLNIVSTSPYEITWPSTILWPSDTEPTMTDDDNDLIELYYDGDYVHGVTLGQNYD